MKTPEAFNDGQESPKKTPSSLLRFSGADEIVADFAASILNEPIPADQLERHNTLDIEDDEEGAGTPETDADNASDDF